jgi:DNA-directed RNA polymerase subunit omega
MKAHLIKAASEVITDQKMLVNVISRRVRQLAFGHRPLVACAPGTGLADVALSEVIEGKLSYESTLVPKEIDEAKTLVPFPTKAIAGKKAA